MYLLLQHLFPLLLHIFVLVSLFKLLFSHILHFSVSYSFLIVPESNIAAMSSIKAGVPISTLPYLHITFSPVSFTVAVDAQHRTGPCVVLFHPFPYFSIFCVSIWCIYFDLRWFKLYNVSKSILLYPNFASTIMQSCNRRLSRHLTASAKSIYVYLFSIFLSQWLHL